MLLEGEEPHLQHFAPISLSAPIRYQNIQHEKDLGNYRQSRVCVWTVVVGQLRTMQLMWKTIPRMQEMKLWVMHNRGLNRDPEQIEAMFLNGCKYWCL